MAVAVSQTNIGAILVDSVCFPHPLLVHCVVYVPLTFALSHSVTFFLLRLFDSLPGFGKLSGRTGPLLLVSKVTRGHEWPDGKL